MIKSILSELTVRQNIECFKYFDKCIYTNRWTYIFLKSSQNSENIFECGKNIFFIENQITPTRGNSLQKDSNGKFDKNSELNDVIRIGAMFSMVENMCS